MACYTKNKKPKKGCLNACYKWNRCKNDMTQAEWNTLKTNIKGYIL